MGYDKLFSFITKNLSSKSYEDLYPIKNIEGYVISKYIYYDINFIIYKSISETENDINNIIKYIYSLEYNKTNYISNNINKILEKLKVSDIIDITKIISNNCIDNILFKFKKEIDKEIDNIIYNKILDYIFFSLYSLHKPYFIKNILIFFDGIPSYSKILEQRKRRINNYLNSVNRKKKYDEKQIENINYFIDDQQLNIKYNYIKYIKNTYSINKNFGPESNFLKDLSVFLYKKLSNNPEINIVISDGRELGEADYKILKHIEENNIIGDITIHSCDSDFLHFLILYQLKNQNKYVNLNYIKFNNDNYQLFNGKNLLYLLINKYKKDNNISELILNTNFIYDILFIIQLFGNDLIPENFELSPDIYLNIYFNCHYKNYNEDKFIININNEEIINFKNLNLFLVNLKKYNLFTVNLLTKNFKLSNKFISIISHTLNYDIKDFILKLIIPYHQYEFLKLGNIIDNDDIRNKYTKNNDEIKNPINDLKLDSSLKEYIQDYIKTIFDYTNDKDYGLMRLVTTFNIDDNPYQSYYNYVMCESFNETQKKLNMGFKFTNLMTSYDEYINYTNNIDIKNYLDIVFNQTKILFYDFKFYKPDCKIYCKSNIAPSLDNLIKFTSKYDYYKLPSDKFNNTYFNKETHHLIITPYLLDNPSYLDGKNKFMINILNLMNNKINSLFDINNINLRDINPDLFIFEIVKLLDLYTHEQIKNLYKNNLLLE